MLAEMAEAGDKLALEALQMGDDADKVFLSEALEINFKIEGSKATPKRRQHVERSVRYLIELAGDKPVDAYTRADARAFRDKFIEDEKITTGKRNQTNLQGLFRRVYDELDIDQPLPFSGIRWPEDTKTKETPTFETSELQLISDRCKEMDDDIRWIVALLLDTGCRAAEVIGLSTSDIVLDALPHT